MALERKIDTRDRLQKFMDSMGIIAIARIPCETGKSVISCVEKYIEENKGKWGLKETEVIGYEPFCFGYDNLEKDKNNLIVPTKIFRYNSTRDLFGRVRYKLVTS